jgi:hypothetical protein
MFEKVLPSIQRGALLINDRYYAKPKIWQALAAQGVLMISRHNQSVKKRRVAVQEELRSSALSFDDWLVEMGGSQADTTPVPLRWIHLWGPGFDITLLTNVRDPSILSPAQLLAAYRRRWSVERMYLAMKDVLELNHLYNCSPAAVGQQVYATAILYNTLRVSQGKIAATASIDPEILSVDKLFPTLIDHHIKAICIAIGADSVLERTQGEASRMALSEIKVDQPFLRVRIRDHLLEKRSERRKRRRFCKGRARVTSYGKIPGAKKLLGN